MTGLHGKRPSIKDYAKRPSRRAVDEETYRVLMGAQQLSMKKSVCSCASIWRSQPRQLQRDRRHNHDWRRLTRMLRSCWLTIGVSLTYHWKNDYNHELLNYWRAFRPCYPSSIKASATGKHKYEAVIKKFAVSFQEEQRSPRTTQQPFR
jgi:hypothetical protein